MPVDEAETSAGSRTDSAHSVNDSAFTTELPLWFPTRVQASRMRLTPSSRIGAGTQMTFTVLFIPISISPGEILEEDFACGCRAGGLPILGFPGAPNTRFLLQTLYGGRSFGHAESKAAN